MTYSPLLSCNQCRRELKVPLKDMAIVIKQQNRTEEAIEAIKSLKGRCSDESQVSLDNILLDLYKRCGRLDDQIALLRHKLLLIQQGLAFNGKGIKTGRIGPLRAFALPGCRACAAYKFPSLDV